MPSLNPFCFSEKMFLLLVGIRSMEQSVSFPEVNNPALVNTAGIARPNELHRHSNATTTAVAYRSEPRYPAMIDKSHLYNGLLTRRGTDCAFWNERVISNRQYLHEGRSHWSATNGSWKCSLCSRSRAGLSRVAIPRRSLHAGMLALLGSLIECNTLEACVAPPGMIRGVRIKLPRIRDVTWKLVFCYLAYWLPTSSVYSSC